MVHWTIEIECVNCFVLFSMRSSNNKQFVIVKFSQINHFFFRYKYCRPNEKHFELENSNIPVYQSCLHTVSPYYPKNILCIHTFDTPTLRWVWWIHARSLFKMVKGRVRMDVPVFSVLNFFGESKLNISGLCSFLYVSHNISLARQKKVLWWSTGSIQIESIDGFK